MRLFRRNRKRRAETLRTYAEDQGLMFFPKDEMGFIRYFGDFKLFRIGTSRRIRPLVRSSQVDYEGDHGLFDYQYVVQSGNAPVPFSQTVYYCIDKSLSLPRFRIFPERLKDRIGKWFGMQDINLPVYPDFSRHYILRGSDETRIKAFFNHDEVIRHFNAHSQWHVEGLGYYMVMYRHNKLVGKDGLETMMDTGSKLTKLLVRRSQQSETGPES